jgi:hypothetical protein
MLFVELICITFYGKRISLVALNSQQFLFEKFKLLKNGTAEDSGLQGRYTVATEKRP